MSDGGLTDIRGQKREQLESKPHGDGGSAAREASAGPTEPIHVDGANKLDDAVASYDVVLVDFYADWCGPCKMLEPIVRKLVENTNAAVAKVDVDTSQELAAQYQVRGVPTMVLFADSETIKQLVGVHGHDDLENLVEAHLA